MTDVYVLGGTLRSTVQGALGTEAGTVYLQGATLAVDGADQVLSNKRLAVGVAGGTLNLNSSVPVRLDVDAP
jgi:hypothetical protein